MIRRVTLTRCVVVPALFLALVTQGQVRPGPRWRVYPAPSGFPESVFRSVTVAEDGAILAAAAESLSFCQIDGYEIKTFPMPSAGAKPICQSPAGQSWTISSNGLWFMASGAWNFLPVREISENAPLCPIRQNVVLVLLPDRLVEVDAEAPEPPRLETLHRASQTHLGLFLGMTVGPNDELWIAGETGIALVAGPKRAISTNSKWQEFISPVGLHLAHFQKPEPDAEGVTLVASSLVDARKVVVHFDGEHWQTRSAGDAEIRFALRGPDGAYWAATDDALFESQGSALVKNTELSARHYFDAAVDWRGTFWLATSAGLMRFTPALWEPSEPPAKIQAPSNPIAAKPLSVPGLGTSADVACSLTTHTGDIWLGGCFGVAWRHDRWVVFPAADKDAPSDIFQFVELPNGQIWCASKEKIWSFAGKNWSLIRGGFQHLNHLICARDGSIWAASNGGIERFVRGNWIENGLEEGLETNVIQSLFEDARGALWAETASGWEMYHPEADSDPPRTSLETTDGRDVNIPEDGVITLMFSGRDKWQITPLQRLLYSHRLDEGEWSPFEGATNMVFSDLAPGRLYFQVRAMDRAGNVDPDPAHLEFAVVLPWYQEGRLIIIATAGAGAAIFFAALAYKHHRQLRLSYALVEKQVAQRTRELEQASHELLHNQKMRALGTLAAGIAHDFNNILSIIKGSSQIIEDNLGSPEKIRTRVSRIKTMVDQGSAVVQALLGFSRGSDEALEPSDINPVVENTLRLLGDRFLREVEIHFDATPGLPRIRASQSLVQQILLNFIFNAAESMNGHKTIRVATALTEPATAGLALPPGPAAAYVSVSVGDRGCGIQPENLPRIFEPFFTTKALSTRRGAGLGLSVAYELAKKMKAGLAVESTPGNGSVFRLILPVAGAEKILAVESP